jgi:hypothetical protein
MLKVWRNIQKAIGKITDFVLEIVRRIRGQVKNLRTSSAALKAKLATKSETMKSATAPLKAGITEIASGLAIGNACDYQTASVIIHNTADTMKAGKEIAMTVSKVSTLFGTLFSREMPAEEIMKVVSKADKLNDELSKDIAATLGKFGKHLDRDNNIAELLNNLFGSKADPRDWFGPIYAQNFVRVMRDYENLNAEVLGMTEKMHHISIQVAQAKTLFTNGEISFLTKDQVSELLSDVDQLISVLDDTSSTEVAVRRSVIELDRLTGSVIKWMEKRVKKELDGYSQLIDEAVNGLKIQINEYIHMVRVFSVKIPGLGLQAAVAGLKYANVSIDNLN